MTTGAPTTGGATTGGATTTGGPKQDRSRLTRHRLLETTIRLLASEGWEATTVGRVAEETTISRGAVQHHFPTRADLVVAALEHMFEVRVAGVDALPDPGGSGRERVRAVVAQLVELVGGDLFTAALQVWTASAGDPQLRAQLIPLERRFGGEAHARAVRLLGVDDRDARVRTLIQATLDLARGLALAGVLTDDRRRRSRIVRAWADHVTDALALA
jgi:AcrR family transcriptional regulator